jgi:hypothetical protein
VKNVLENHPGMDVEDVFFKVFNEVNYEKY